MDPSAKIDAAIAEYSRALAAKLSADSRRDMGQAAAVRAQDLHHFFGSVQGRALVEQLSVQSQQAG